MATRQDTARRLRNHMLAHAERQRNTLRCSVVRVSPLTLERMDSGSQLDVNDDFDLPAWARLYHRQLGLKVGDTVILQEDDGHYVMLDALSDATDTEIDQITTFAIGTVATGLAGTQARATLTGIKPRKLNLTIPKGDKGDQGIQGIQGVPGTPGSAGTPGANATPPIPMAITRVTAASWSGSATIARAGTMQITFGGTCFGTGAGFIALDLVIDGTYADNAFVYANAGSQHMSVVCFHQHTFVSAGVHTFALGPSTGFANTLTDANDCMWIEGVLY